MSPQPSYRFAFTFPTTFASQLGYVAFRLGLTKSEVIQLLLAEPLGQMVTVLQQVGSPLDQLTPEDRDALQAGYDRLLAKALADVAALTEPTPGAAAHG